MMFSQLVVRLNFLERTEGVSFVPWLLEREKQEGNKSGGICIR